MTECKDHGACPSVALGQEIIEKEMSSLVTWSLSPDSKMIFREFKFKNFKEALEFTNKIGVIAEEMNHHPDILLKWGLVKVDYSTHNAGGLTEMDFEAAKRIDSLIESH